MRVALFVGIDQYRDEGINDLSCAVNDASAVCETLRQKGYETHILLNENAGKISVLNKVEELCKDLQDNDVFLFYFAGHGHETGGNHYLLCHNAKTATLDIDGGADAIPLAAVTAISENRNLRRLFILDSCRNNIRSSARSTYKASRDISFLTEKSYDDDYFPPVLLRSCCGGQCAFEDKETGHGFFTLAFLDALESANSFSGFIKSLQQTLSKKIKGKKQKISLSDGTNGFPLLDGWIEETKPEEKAIVTGKNTVWQKFIAMLAVIAIVISGVAIYKNIIKEDAVTPQIEEKKVAELITKTTALKEKLEEEIGEILKKKYNPGQTFGIHLDNLNQLFNKGKNALKKYDYREAFQYFEKAELETEWIKTNAPLRDKTQEFFGIIGNLITTCNTFNAQDLASSLFLEATQKAASARAEYDNGNFQIAINLLKEAETSYKQACAEAKKKTLEDLERAIVIARKERKWDNILMIAPKLAVFDRTKAESLITEANLGKKADALEAKLKQARQAKANQNWQQMFDFANEALAIDFTNQEAQRLKTEAEQQLVPSFTIHPKVNGTYVQATFTAKKKQPLGDTWPKQLDKNEEYQFELSYKAEDGTIYIGELSFTCNWNGPKTFEVELKKLDFSRIELPNGGILEMVKIQAGSFQREGNTVTLTKPFYLGKYEVTQAQWKAVMGSNPSSIKGDNLPVENVSWHDAKEFCKKLNEIYADKLPAGYQFDLPTEAQWEYACRAGTTTDLNNGKSLTSYVGECSNLDEVAWYNKNSGDKPHEIGQKRANAWGLYDMHGNVWEWCRDWYEDYPGGSVTDPVGPLWGSYRVIRGGSWNYGANDCRSAFRFNYNPSYRYSHYGFRLALASVQ